MLLPVVVELLEVLPGLLQSAKDILVIGGTADEGACFFVFFDDAISFLSPLISVSKSDMVV